MPLSFMNPALLFGALASALPVIIHFLSRRRVRRRMFSDLRFLDEVQARQARSLGIRRWLLLALRVLAILLVALAAAGPRWGGIGPVGGTRSVLVVIDSSASMNTQMDEGTRLTAAVAAAGDMIAALPSEAAVQVLVAGSRTRPLFGDWLPAGSGARRALERVQPTDGVFDLAAVLREASRQVARAPGSPVEVILLSDLQDVPHPEDPSAAAERLLGSGEARFLLRQVGRTETGGGITGLELPRRALRPGESVTVRARVIAERADQVFSLELGGAPVAEAVAEGAAGPMVLEFPLTVPLAGDHRGLIRKESDVFPTDDTRPFLLTVPPAVRVLLVHGEDRPGDPAAGRGGWRYLAEALAPGQGPSPFVVRTVPGDELTTGDFGTTDVVVLVDPGPLGRRTLEGFTAWLAEGGASLVLVGDPNLASYLRDSLLPALGLEGGAEYRTTPAPGQRTRIVDPAHPVFAGLDAEALATFTDVAWRRWFTVSDPPGSALMVFSGGDPGFVAGEVGDGRYGLLPFNLAVDGGDLAESPMVLPFLQRTVSWLAADTGRGRAGNLTVGGEAVMNPRTDAADVLERPEDLVLDGPAAAAGPTAVQLEWRTGRARLRGGVLDHAGFYTFLAGPDTLGQIAAAVPGTESVLTLLTPAAMGDQLDGLGLNVAADLSGTLPTSFLAALGGRSLAPWFLALAVILLLLETALGRGSGRHA